MVRTMPADQKKESQEQCLVRRLTPLIGCELSNVALDAAGNVAFVFVDDTGHTHYASITRDPEGNGPGWVDVEYERPSPAYAHYITTLPAGSQQQIEEIDILCDLADDVMHRKASEP